MSKGKNEHFQPWQQDNLTFRPSHFVASEIAHNSCDSICVNSQLAQRTKSAAVLSAPEQIP